MLSTNKLTPEQTKALEILARNRAAQGLPTPMWEDRPSIYSDLAWVWEAFQDLCRTRNTGWGVAPITYQEILAWSDLHQVPKEIRVKFTRWIKTLDSVWLKNHHEKHEKSK